MVLIVLPFVRGMPDVIIAVTVITRVLGEFQPIVVQTHIAGDMGPNVCLKFLVESVAAHGIGIGGVVVIVANFLSIYTHNHTHTHTNTHKLGWRLVGMIILYNICNWVSRCTHTCGTVVPKG